LAVNTYVRTPDGARQPLAWLADRIWLAALFVEKSGAWSPASNYFSIEAIKSAEKAVGGKEHVRKNM
jgi:hypothetical protein